MLRRFWIWLVGVGEPNPLYAVLEVLVQNQEKSNTQMFQAIQEMHHTGQAQAEVMKAYLKLFAPAAGDSERNGWKESDEKPDVAITHPGFPKDGTEAEQAEWVLAHLDETL